jgi:hypothetical protein
LPALKPLAYTLELKQLKHQSKAAMHPNRTLAFSAVAFLLAQGCDVKLFALSQSQTPTNAPGATTDSPPADPPEPLPELDELPLRVGVAKAKDLLTGLPVTSEELAQAGDIAKFKTLVDGWTSLPQFEETMLRFFS